MASYYPPLKRKNSVGFVYRSNPTLEEANETIFDLFKIGVDDIIGFQRMRGNRVIVKFRDHILYETFINQYDETTYNLSGGNNVRVVNLMVRIVSCL